ncbi:MAG: hypothetical protein WKF30_05805 [Pyrinomonadaceae bacterium]
MLKKMFCAAVICLGATVTEAASNNVVELALTEVGTGSAEEMKTHLQYSHRGARR